MNDTAGSHHHTTPDDDWRAMREWLITTLSDARIAAAHTPMLPGGFEAQVEVLASALNFMDARERAYLAAGRDTAGGGTRA